MIKSQDYIKDLHLEHRGFALNIITIITTVILIDIKNKTRNMFRIDQDQL